MRKTVVLYSVIIITGLFALVVYQKLTLDDGKLHVVVCDVGQGDAIFIRSPGGADILIDGGPDDKVLNCLGRHMPFWDRSLEMVVLTHPHADHLIGLISVIKSYSVLQFIGNISGQIDQETEGLKELKSQINSHNIKITTVTIGDRFRIKDGTLFSVLWPPQDFVSSDVNDLSIVFLLNFSDFEALLTGDAGVNAGYQRVFEGQVDLLKVPHHGSRTGLSAQFMDQVRLGLAVISVGKKNKFGHPHEETLKILTDKDIKTLRTDLDGEVAVISNGKKWWVE